MSPIRMASSGFILGILFFATALPEPVVAQPAAVVETTQALNFRPRTVTIRPGGTVEWRNTSSLVHTVTADPRKAADPSHVQLPARAETFDSGPIQPGGVYRRTFTVPGRYQYVCLPHERAGMIGEVIVQR